MSAYAVEQLWADSHDITGRRFHVAKLTTSDGARLTVSRYAEEDRWMVDSLVMANGYPVTVTRPGDRYSAKRALDPSLTAELDSLRELYDADLDAYCQNNPS